MTLVRAAPDVIVVGHAAAQVAVREHADSLPCPLTTLTLPIWRGHQQ